MKTETTTKEAFGLLKKVSETFDINTKNEMPTFLRNVSLLNNEIKSFISKDDNEAEIYSDCINFISKVNEKEPEENDESYECPMNNLIDRLKTQYTLVYKSLDFITKFESVPTIFEEHEEAFKLKGMLIKIGFSKEREEYFFVISYNGLNFNSLKDTEWCFNFEITAQMACIEKSYELLIDSLLNPTPMEMANIALEKVRGKNIELWVDGKQTEYWKEIFCMGVNAQRDILNTANQKI